MPYVPLRMGFFQSIQWQSSPFAPAPGETVCDIRHALIHTAISVGVLQAGFFFFNFKHAVDVFMWEFANLHTGETHIKVFSLGAQLGLFPDNYFNLRCDFGVQC